MSGEALKLSVYFGEGGRAGARPLWSGLMDVFADAPLDVALLLRGIEGFGSRRSVRTDRVLSLSEDLPMVTVAVGPAETVRGLADAAVGILDGGVVLMERLVVIRGPQPMPHRTGDAKLAVYCTRSGAVGRDVVTAMRRAGMDGAALFAGLDGVVRGERRRARLMSRNQDVPAIVVATGSAAAAAAVLPHLRNVAGVYLTTVERVRVLKRDGAAVAAAPEVADGDSAGSGAGLWLRFSVLCGEDDRHEGRPLHAALVEALLHAGASGATSLRGVYGFSRSGPPHGDRLLSVRRRTPTIVTFVERPSVARRLWPLVDAVTDEAGLVTCEVVPARLAPSGGDRAAGMQLAAPEVW